MKNKQFWTDFIEETLFVNLTSLLDLQTNAPFHICTHAVNLIKPNFFNNKYANFTNAVRKLTTAIVLIFFSTSTY